MPKLIEQGVKTIRGLALVTIALGLLCIFLPRGVGLTVGALVGVLLVIAGALRVVFAWVAASWGSMLLRFAFGVVAILAGGALLTQPEIGLNAIIVIAVAYLVADGVGCVLFALRLPPAAGGASMVISGLVSLAMAMMIWRGWPLPAEQMIGIWIGVKLMIDGGVMMAVAQGAHRIDEALAQSEVTRP